MAGHVQVEERGLLDESMREESKQLSSEEEEKKNERAVKEGFLRRRVVWFGGREDWQRDLLFFLENEHTLLSLCRSHSYHQFDRESRITYLACVLCLNLFFAAWLEQRNEEYGRFDYILSLLLSSTILVGYDYALRILATSPCIQQGGCLGGLCYLCRDTCLDLGKLGLTLCLVISAGFALTGLVLGLRLRVTPSHFLSTFVIMRALAYITEIAPRSFTFYRLREGQRKYWHPTSHPPPTGGAYPLGRNYPTEHYLLGRRHYVDPLADSVSIDTTASERNRINRQARAQERQQRADRLFGASRSKDPLSSSTTTTNQNQNRSHQLPETHRTAGLELQSGTSAFLSHYNTHENNLLVFDDQEADDIETMMNCGSRSP